MPFCIGVTGGIGSGKSQAAAMFAELGAGVVDTDEISHEITSSGGGAMADIAAAFGKAVIRADGGLDRAAMRKLVFNDPLQRKRLEEILHPRIRAESRHRVDLLHKQPYVLLVVPLLLESGGYKDLIQRVLVVDCDEDVQISRTMQRSQLAADAVRAIMAAQLPRAQRLSLADDVIDNSGDLSHLRNQVAALHEQYLRLAASGRKSV